MNELVFKYGEKAKEAELTLKDYVLEMGTEEEQKLAELLGNNEYKTVIGDSCDEGDPKTENDVYTDTNGTCQGTIVKSSIKCYGEPIGSYIIVEGVSYLVVDNNTIGNNLENPETLCTSNVTDMSTLFTEYFVKGDISNWDVSNVTNMNDMFAWATFNSNMDLSNWDVSNVTNMENMFNWSVFNGDLSKWNVSNVTNMYNMFANSKFNNDSLKNWDIKNQYGFYGMFEESEFNGDLSGWDVSNVYNLELMFRNSKFNNNSIKNWNIQNVRNANGMFEASLFNQDISNWDTTSLLYYGGFGSSYLEENYYPIFVN